MADLMSQIQELRTSVCEKTETVDTLEQELNDITVSSVTSKIINLSTSQTHERCVCSTKQSFCGHPGLVLCASENSQVPYLQNPQSL